MFKMSTVSKKSILLVSVLPFFLSTAGCMVSKSTYLQKVDEANSLNSSLMSSQRKVNELTQREQMLNTEIEELQAEKRELEKLLQAKSDELSMSIVDLRKRNEEFGKKNKELESKKIKLEKSIEEKAEEINQLKQKIANLEKIKEKEVQEVSKTYGEMIKKMKSEVAQGQVTITELKGKLTVNLLDAILFDSGEAEIKPEGLTVLTKVIDVLKGVSDKAIRVEGHTDNVKISGALIKKYPTNWELSSARSINVVKYLQNQGLDPNVLSVAAFSEYKPVASNDTREERAKNRRIEIILVPKE
ncbi:MAG: Rnase Y domain-containing protein [bacterium]